ncbi:MAG TPA: aldo/keto reductase [Polyangiaceae bacterium]|nr:aldo/keto reductase [Polyangiaceae bacterium]
MRTQPFGATGVAVPVLGQGTWQLPADEAGERGALEALEAGVERGMTHLDTAEMYGRGRAEELVGRLLARRPRGELFVVSKVLPSNASREGTRRACERSLRRLGAERLDVYLLHWRGSYPLEETMRALEDLVAAGKTRFVGVSNFDVDDLKEAQRALGRERIACNQVLYHLGARAAESELLPYCQREGIALVAYSPFGSGDFPDERRPGGALLARIGRAHGKSARQVALRFLLRSPGVFAIPKTARREHAEENAAAADFDLSDDEVAAIDRAFPAPPAGTPLGSI